MGDREESNSRFFIRMTSSFLKEIVKTIDNDYAGLLSEGGVGDIESFVDTGSHISVSYTHLTLPTNREV